MGRIIRQHLRDFLRDRSGTAALEFALLAMPFIVLLMAIIETGLIFYAEQTLQTATTQSGRLIMTGQAQTQGMSQAQFKQAVCLNAQPLFNCSAIYVNVQTFATFSSITTPSLIQNGQFNSGKVNYTPGMPGDIVLVQVFYLWPVITGLPGLTLANTGSSRLLQATAVFRNEPY